MDDLRSLEGVGQLLSEKLKQSQLREMHQRRFYQRSSSVPKLDKTTTPQALKKNSVAISQYFDPGLASHLTKSLATGFAQSTPNVHSPALPKSHSFASNEVPLELRKFKSVPTISNKSTPKQSGHRDSSPIPNSSTHLNNNYTTGSVPEQGNSVRFADDFVFTESPTDDKNPPHSLDNSYTIPLNDQPAQKNVPSNTLAHSFSLNKNGATLHLDLGGLDFDLSYDATDTLRFDSRNSSIRNSAIFESGDLSGIGGILNNIDNHRPSNKSTRLDTITSMESQSGTDFDSPSSNGTISTEKHKSPQSPKPPGAGKTPRNLPQRLSSVYSNRSLFSLDSIHTDSYHSYKSSMESLLESNTKLNAQTSTGSSDSKEIDSLDLKEDFMEFHQESQDAFNSIGSGASGIVRKAFHFRSCKLVAIKQCRSKDKREERAFVREAALYKKFYGHEHIPSIYGFGKDKDNGSLMMCLEFMDLLSCDTLKIAETKSFTMKTRELAVGHIVYGTLQALKSMHAELYVHNDIKPANILVNHFGEIKLSDLGTVLQLKSKSARLKRNNGTQRYQAPEKIVNSKGISYSTKSDIWSLGISAYELLLGDSYNAIDETKYCTNPPKLSPKKNPGLSKECCKFINKCFTVNDRKRPSAEALLKMDWMKQIKKKPIEEKWAPWYIEIEDEKEKDDPDTAVLDAIGLSLSPIHSRTKSAELSKSKSTKKKGKSVQFSDDGKDDDLPTPKPAESNEDLFFMITSMVIYYLTQNVDFASSKGSELHRRRSIKKRDDNEATRTYSDEERIGNMAKYAHCSKETVREKIRSTVSHIKAQMGRMEAIHSHSSMDSL